MCGRVGPVAHALIVYLQYSTSFNRSKVRHSLWLVSHAARLGALAAGGTVTMALQFDRSTNKPVSHKRRCLHCLRAHCQRYSCT